MPNFIGLTKTVCGKVASSKYASGSNRQPKFLNLDRAYPDQIFTILISGIDRPKFKAAPEDVFQGKRVCVTGDIQSYRGKPEIIVSEPSQIGSDSGPR